LNQSSVFEGRYLMPKKELTMTIPNPDIVKRLGRKLMRQELWDDQDWKDWEAIGPALADFNVAEVLAAIPEKQSTVDETD
jgi:hypothetical protein